MMIPKRITEMIPKPKIDNNNDNDCYNNNSNDNNNNENDHADGIDQGIIQLDSNVCKKRYWT